MPSVQLREREAEREAKAKALHSVLEEGRTDPAGNRQELDLDAIKSIDGDASAKLNEIRKRKAELDDIGAAIEELRQLEDVAAVVENAREHVVKGARFDPADAVPTADAAPEQVKTLGRAVIESDAYAQWTPGTSKKHASNVEYESAAQLKTVFSTSAGWAPENTRIGRLVEEALRPIQVIDTIPGGETTQAAVVYMEETTVTSAAAERSEGAAYAESTLALTEQTNTVRSIGTSLPVTDEQLADVPQVESYINMRLPNMINRRLDGQILVGDGSAPNLKGINNVSGILTQALGGDTVPDAVYKGLRQVRVTGRAMPNIIYAHPNDWESIRLLRTADGIYIWGSPAEAGVQRIWGVTVVETDAQTENTILGGDTTFSQLFMRQDMLVEIGTVNDDFLDGRQTVRAGLRAAFVVYRPAAFVQITGV